jgi:hypothetical protein
MVSPAATAHIRRELRKEDRRVRLVVVFLMSLVVLPRPGFSQKPCSCADLCKMESRLEARKRLLEAARQVAEEAAMKAFPTARWAKARFIEIAFPGQQPTVEGVQQFGQEPKISEEHKRRNCDSIWKATEAHELDHDRFDKTVADWKYLAIMAGGQEGKFLALKEVSGYAAEVSYLSAELDRLKRDCPRENCGGEEEEPEQPVLERYQEQNRQRRAEAKERVSRAAERVSRYAASID